MSMHDAHSALESVLGRIIQGFMVYLHHTGLSGPQIHALLYIYHADECRVSDIGMLSGASPAAASQLVERLVQQGLVERSEDASNRRIKQLRLTTNGRRLIHEGVVSNRVLTDLLASLSPAQRKTVDTAFGYLAQASQELHMSNQEKVPQHA